MDRSYARAAFGASPQPGDLVARIPRPDEPGGARTGHRLGARGDAELLVNRGRLRLHRVLRDEELLRDLAEAEVRGQVAQEAQLGGAQRPATVRRRGVGLLPGLLEPDREHR